MRQPLPNRQRRQVMAAAALTSALLTLSCAGSSERQSGASKASMQTSSSNVKEKAKAKTPTGSTPAAGVLQTPGGKAAAGPTEALFSGKAQALGMDICSGTLNIAVNLNALVGGSVELFQIPQSAVQCSLVGEVDLRSLLGSFGQKATSGSKAVADLQHHVIGVSTLAGSTFTPPWPLLPALFGSSAADLAKIDLKTDLTLTSPTGKVAKGSSHLTMLSYDQPYTVATTGKVFPHSIGFSITNSGFDGVDKNATMLFDTLEFHISIDPIAILSMTIKGTLQSLLKAQDAAAESAAPTSLSPTSAVPAAPAPSFLSSLVGSLPIVPVQMTIDLIEQTGLDEAVAAAVKDKGAGDSIGGKKLTTP